MRWILTACALVVGSSQASAQTNLCAKANQPVDAKVLLTNVGKTGTKIADIHRLCRAETKVQVWFGPAHSVEGYITHLTPDYFELQFLPTADEPRSSSATLIHIPLASLRSMTTQLRGVVRIEVRPDR